MQLPGIMGVACAIWNSSAARQSDSSLSLSLSLFVPNVGIVQINACDLINGIDGIKFNQPNQI